MPAITYTEARKHLGETMDRVIDDHQPVVITRANGKNAVLISQEDFDAWQETAYLLRSPANASDLRQAMAELGERRGLVRHDRIDTQGLQGDPHAAIAHDRSDYQIAGEPTRLFHRRRADGQYLIPRQDGPLFIHGNQSIGIAIEGKADGGLLFHHGSGQGFRVLGTAVQIDIDAVRGVEESCDLSA